VLARSLGGKAGGRLEDGGKLFQQCFVAECDANVGNVGTVDVVTCDTFLEITVTEPMFLHLYRRARTHTTQLNAACLNNENDYTDP